VVFGGTSAEHPVSCLTARAVVGAIDPEQYEVIGVGITRSGRWVVVGPEQLEQLRVEGNTMPELTEDAADTMLVPGVAGGELVRRTAGGTGLAAMGRSARTARSRGCSR
jgi:D-alanine-D-alanine ligase